MYGRIKEITPAGYGVILLMMLVAILLWIWIPHLLRGTAGTFPLTPWVHGNFISLRSAIELFNSGQVAVQPYFSEKGEAFLFIALFLILGPGLLIIGNLHSEGEHRGLRRYLSGFRVGLAVTLAGMIILGADSAVRGYSYLDTNKEYGRSTAHDRMRIAMTYLATESYQYQMLPSDKGGGSGTFAGLRAESLPSYSRFAGLAQFDFEVIEADTVLRITGSAPEVPGAKPLVLRVEPHDMITWVRNSSTAP